MIDALLYFLDPLLEDKPFALFGHSMGAKIAYELARALDGSSRAPRVLFVSGCPAPHTEVHRPRIAALPPDAFLEELRRLAGTPEKALSSPELMALMLPCLRADYALSESHDPSLREPLSVPLVALGGRDDAEVTADELRAWRSYTTSTFRAREFAGGHFFTSSARAELLDYLRECLHDERSIRGEERADLSRAAPLRAAGGQP